jgi:hypothetical protein
MTLLARRAFLQGGLIALAAPAIIRTPGLIMPLRVPRKIPAGWMQLSDGTFHRAGYAVIGDDGSISIQGDKAQPLRVFRVDWKVAQFYGTNLA